MSLVVRKLVIISAKSWTVIQRFRGGQPFRPICMATQLPIPNAMVIDSIGYGCRLIGWLLAMAYRRPR